MTNPDLMTLAEFLLARIAEAELFWQTVGEAKQAHPQRVARYLADCEAKRRIVERFGRYAEDPTDGYEGAGREALSILAAVYADHPDYDPGWAA